MVNLPNGNFALIYDYIRAVPAGKVVSYGDVGAAVGLSARMIGWALADCPEDVPWQRVVGADGYLRIARRSAELRTIQETLLKSEGVELNEAGCVKPEFFLGATE